METVLVLPRWITYLELYGDNGNDFNICFGKLDIEDLDAQYVVGLSLGALIVLKNIENIQGRIILINPPVPKRGLVQWFVQWVGFITNEGLFLKRQKFTINPLRFISGLIDCLELFSIDFSKILDDVPKDTVTVIRGKNDTFFCDESAVNFLRSKNIRVIEVEGGHNWGEEIEKALANLLST